MKAIITLILYLLPLMSIAQHGSASTPASIILETETNFGAITGVHYGNVWMGELGLGIGKIERGHGVYSYQNITTSIEFNPNQSIYGVKVGAWRNFGIILPLSFGISTISYFENNNFNQILQPAIGLGYGPVQLVYTFNICLGQPQISELNSSQISLRCYLPYITIKRQSRNPLGRYPQPLSD